MGVCLLGWQLTLRELEIVQASALHICCGVFHTTPVHALLVELGEILNDEAGF